MHIENDRRSSMTCRCGLAKRPASFVCKKCRLAGRGKGRTRSFCSCGQQLSFSAKQCAACVRAQHRLKRTHVCEGCGSAFVRRRKKNACRYCSRRCAFNHAADWIHPLPRYPRSFPLQVVDRHCEGCQAILTNRQRRFCSQACGYAHMLRTKKEARTRSFVSTLRLCPACGEYFGTSANHDQIFCSRPCNRRFNRKGRYPSLKTVPQSERQQLASLISLMREARHHIDRERKRAVNQ